ncbi:Type I Iterative PKS [Apiospora saccharicola]
MLAVGLSAVEVARCLSQDDRSVKIACLNSPRSVTLSRVLSALEELGARSEPDGHFDRLLYVSMACHSDHSAEAGTRYLDMLQGQIKDTAPKTNDNNVAVISTVDGTELGK